MGSKGNIPEVKGSELNLIGKGTSIDGDLTAESSIRIDGRIKGKVICKGTLTIGEGGEIEGEVEAQNAIVSGRIKGKLFVQQKLVLESTSRLEGELRASKLIVDEGATFNGVSDMGGNKPGFEANSVESVK